VDDDFLIIAQYPPTRPLPPDEPGAGSRLSGLRAVLGATVLSTHVDAEQPRFRIEGNRGSYEKRGTDPQENQLKKGWTPANKGQAFGVYEEHEPPAIKLGRLTTSLDAGSEAVKAGSGSGAAGAAPVQPKLAVNDVPTLPGLYTDYYKNVAQAIRAGESAKNGSGSVEAAHRAIDQVLVVKPQEAAQCIKFLNLARQSALEGRTVEWE
jgi:predicted dehydrogenase